MSKLKSLSDEALANSFCAVAKRERQATADLIEHIHEFTRRKLYLKHGYTSTFMYLVKVLRYSSATAQNRIDAARLIEDVPNLQMDLASGDINLTQVSIMASALRQKSKESDEVVSAKAKREMCEKLKGRDSHDSGVIVARELDLKLKAQEKVRPQKDESVVLEITLSKEQMAVLRRIRDLSSHQDHNASWADVILRAADFYIEKNDPAVMKTRRSKHLGSDLNLGDQVATSKSSSETTLKAQSETVGSKVTSSTKLNSSISIQTSKSKITSDPKPRRPIPISVRRFILKRDGCCRWRDSKIHALCGSTYQLQVDHIRPVHLGGGNELWNLQALCGVHNRWKYQKEAGLDL